MSIDRADAVHVDPAAERSQGHDTGSASEGHARLQSPVGDLVVRLDRTGAVCALSMVGEREPLEAPSAPLVFCREPAPAPFAAAVERLAQAFNTYFRGDFSALGQVPIAPTGSEFQRRVWESVRSVPAGSTITYGELAASVGKSASSSARAVGTAVGANPIAILIPCHRVVGSDGDLRGFAWGLPLKRRLLEHEGAAIVCATTLTLPGM